MAKSIRSKWKRKMRNVKREKYAKRDLERLKQMTVKAAQQNEVDMSELYTVKTAEDLKRAAKTKDAAEGSSSQDTSMEVDSEKKKYDPKTHRDEHGHYPVWMNQRAIQKVKQKLKKGKKGKKTNKW